jgi:hypothetical protein
MPTVPLNGTAQLS